MEEVIIEEIKPTKRRIIKWSDEIKKARSVRISYETRMVISIMQWIVVIIFTALTVIALVDIFYVGNDPKEWVGDDEDEVIDGVKQKIGCIPWIVYLVLNSIMKLVSIISFILEWYIYRMEFVGFDLTWHYSVDEISAKKNMRKAITRARKCWTLCGTNYINFYRGITKCSVAMLFFLCFHIFFERDTSRFASAYPSVYFPLVVPVFFFGLIAAYIPTQDEMLYESKYGLKDVFRIFYKAGIRSKLRNVFDKKKRDIAFTEKVDLISVDDKKKKSMGVIEFENYIAKK